MKNFKSLAGVCLIAIFLITSCVKDGSITTDSKLKYSIRATNLSASVKNSTAESGFVVPVAANGSLNCTAGKVNISKIEFSAKKAGVELKFETKEIYNSDVLRTDALIGEIPLASGVYENLRFKIYFTESASLVPVLFNGNYYNPSGVVIPVEAKFNMTQSFVYEMPRVEITQGNYVAEINFQMNNLLKGLNTTDFTEALKSGTNNTISISSITNRSIFEKMLVKLQSCVSVSVVKK